MPALAPMLVVLGLLTAAILAAANPDAVLMPSSRTLSLPQPARDGAVSLERALSERRTQREFAAEPLTLAEVAQLLWAMQGETGREGGRTAPSAGALYPLEVYVAVGAMPGADAGVYRYLPATHALVQMVAGDVRDELAAAALGQRWLAQAGAVFVISAASARTTGKYGERGLRFVHLEAGHAAQNALLQSVALGLHAGEVGAFEDAQVARLLRLPAAVAPLYLLPIGRPPSH